MPILDNLYFMYLMTFLLSLAVGSLLNVIIHRLPIMLENEWREQCHEFLHLAEPKVEQINLFFPRSFCPTCKNLVNAWQNIPLLSYLFLKGRCYKCKAPISFRYPLVELVTVALSLYASWHFGFNLTLVFVLPAIALLIVMFFIDLDHQILPDSLTLGLLWLGLIANTQHLFVPLQIAVLSAAGGYLFLWFFIKIFYVITGKIGMGNGDFKLFAAFGAWFGWTVLPLVLLISSIAGAIIGIIYLHIKQKDKNTTIPFGPFLCIASVIALFWGNTLIDWYLKILV